MEGKIAKGPSDKITEKKYIVGKRMNWNVNKVVYK